MTVRQKISAAVSGAGIALCLPVVAFAATTTVVTPTNTQGWSVDDTGSGGVATIVSDATAPGTPHTGAVKLTTSSSTDARAKYMHATNTPLSHVTELSYSTKQNTASFNGGDASYQLPVCLSGVTEAGACNDFTTLVFEPYENGTVTPGIWQSWDVSGGQFWSTRARTHGTCTVSAGNGGSSFYTLSQLKTACPDAVVVGFGVNIGSNNPSYDVEADLVSFNGTAYNFEPFVAVNDKDNCKNDGWKTAKDSANNGFKNQGQCVSFVENSSHQPSVVTQVRNFFGL